MKRSQAIKLIENILKSGYDYPAITILDKLESIGMLPPNTGGYHQNYWDEEDETTKD